MRVAGFGFRKGADARSLEAALRLAGGAIGLTHIATIESKAGAAFHSLAERLALPVQLISEAELSEAAVSTHSDRSIEIYGTGSVSEAVALIAAGATGQLVVSRVVSQDGMAPCAIAEGSNA